MCRIRLVFQGGTSEVFSRNQHLSVISRGLSGVTAVRGLKAGDAVGKPGSEYKVIENVEETEDCAIAFGM